MVTLTPGDPITVRLVKGARTKLAYPAAVVRDDGAHLVIRADFAGDAERDLGYVRFEFDDMFTEHYWRDRWYSIKEVRAAGGRLKGWYCDVTRPVRVQPGLLVSADLDLDLWRSADGATVLRLDEDEFAASGLTETDPAAAAQAVRALDELESLARTGFTDLLH